MFDFQVGVLRMDVGVERVIQRQQSTNTVLDTFGQVPERLDLPTSSQQSREMRFIGRHRELDIGS